MSTGFFRRNLSTLVSLAASVAARPGFQPGPPEVPAQSWRDKQFKQFKQIRERERANLHQAWRAWHRRWAPPGGGPREVARRRRQIEEGMLQTTATHLGNLELRRRQLELRSRGLEPHGGTLIRMQSSIGVEE